MDVADSYGECFVQGFNVRLDPKMRLILWWFMAAVALGVWSFQCNVWEGE